MTHVGRENDEKEESFEMITFALAIAHRGLPEWVLLMKRDGEQSASLTVR